MRNQQNDMGNATRPAEGRIWNRMFISIFFANMALNFGQQMSNSLLAKYADSMGAPATAVGMLMGMFAVTALLLRIIAGPAMDVYNRKFMVMGAMAVMATAYFGFSASHSIHALMGFRLLQGCGNAFANVACMAMVSDALPRDKFGTGMGYYSLAQVIVQAVAPTVGLQFVSWFGYSTTYLIDGFIMLTAIAVAGQIRLSFTRTRTFRLTLDRVIAKEAVLPAIILMIMSISFNNITSFLIVFASKQGVETGIGLFFTVYAITMLFTRPMIGRLTDRYGLVRMAVPAILCTALSFVIISFSRSLPMFLVAAFVNAFGYGAIQPALQSVAMKAVPRERRGSASSTNYIGVDLGTIFGPVIGGMIAQNLGYPFMWRMQLIPLLVAIGIVVAYRGRITRVEQAFMETAQGAA